MSTNRFDLRSINKNTFGMKNLLVALFVGIGAAACSPYRVLQNEADPAVNWSAYRTYSFVDTARIDPTPGITYQAAMDELKRAVTTELTSRGYQQTPSYGTADQPDLLVNIGAVMKEKTQTRTTNIREAPLYIGQRRYHWQSQEVPVGTYDEGTINLHIIDAKRNDLIWDVAVASVLKNGFSQQTVNDAVAKAFGKFPGKKVESDK